MNEIFPTHIVYWRNDAVQQSLSNKTSAKMIDKNIIADTDL